MTGKQKAILIIIFLIPFLFIDIINYLTEPSKYDVSEEITFLIPKGASLNQVADTLSHYDIIDNKEIFVVLGKVTGAENKLRAGRYRFNSQMDYYEIFDYLTGTKSEPIYITVIEGSSNEMVADAFAGGLNIDRQKFLQLCRDSLFIERILGEKRPSLLGYLMPETYAFDWGTKEEQIIRYLVRQTLKIFERDSVQKAMNHFQMTRHQVITMASIIEGEAILDKERSTIASVYHNRLERGMRLQADPTIQFIIPGEPRRLLYDDLKIDSPYNTYIYKGLPPGPINNPSKASILAAISPEKTDYYYFVARGDGSHVFSRTASEHVRAKAEFDKIRRKVRANKK
ncbi:MAG: endolytic transglycosylase MltG [Caldithrix sp.]|nr:endolytic transglycosylase MltG [Caldithrix sp.]